MKIQVLFLLSVAVAQAADDCNPVQLTGPYAVQLSGMTTISGTPQPVVSLARIVFDGSGKVSGTASAMFSGLLLGNPVTGAYEVQTDCSITWKLQDDSGAFQNFSGKFTPDLRRANIRQTDPGGASGLLEKTSDSCTSADLRKKYAYTVSGSTKAMEAGDVAGNVSAKGTFETAGNGSFQVDSDCTVHFVMTLPDSDLAMRGFLVNGGKEILAFQTDPGAMVSAHLTEEIK